MTNYPPEPGIPGEPPGPSEDDQPVPGVFKELLDKYTAQLGDTDLTKYPYVAPKPEELQSYIDAAIVSPPVDPTAVLRADGEEIKIEDLPTADLRAMMGYGHLGPFLRPIVERTDGKQWPYTPNMCLIASNPKGVWVDPQHLACPGCGLDLT